MPTRPTTRPVKPVQDETTIENFSANLAEDITFLQETNDNQDAWNAYQEELAGTRGNNLEPDGVILQGEVLNTPEAFTDSPATFDGGFIEDYADDIMGRTDFTTEDFNNEQDFALYIKSTEVISDGIDSFYSIVTNDGLEINWMSDGTDVPSMTASLPEPFTSSAGNTSQPLRLPSFSNVENQKTLIRTTMVTKDNTLSVNIDVANTDNGFDTNEYVRTTLTKTEFSPTSKLRNVRFRKSEGRDMIPEQDAIPEVPPQPAEYDVNTLLQRNPLLSPTNVILELNPSSPRSFLGEVATYQLNINFGGSFRGQWVLLYDDNTNQFADGFIFASGTSTTTGDINVDITRPIQLRRRYDAGQSNPTILLKERFKSRDAVDGRAEVPFVPAKPAIPAPNISTATIRVGGTSNTILI